MWAPNRQADVATAVGKYYDLSQRLLGIICTEPINHKHKSAPLDRRRYLSKSGALASDEDIELAESQNGSGLHASLHDPTHYEIVNQMINFQSVDYGEHCM